MIQVSLPMEAGPRADMGLVMEDHGAPEIGAGPELTEMSAPNESRKMKKEKKKHYVRSAAGQVWEDATLTEWNPGQSLLK